MRKMPRSIKEHVSNAEYYREAANLYPPPTKNAIHLLLLLIGWENIVIADKELEAWAKNDTVNSQVYKSHAIKLDIVPEVLRIIPQVGKSAVEKRYSGGSAFQDLRLVCQYGSNKEGKDVKKIFNSDWNLRPLERELINKINWVNVTIKALETYIARSKKT